MGYIYFVGNEHGAIKIGFTSNALRYRFAQLQSDNADRLTILGTFRGDVSDEGQIHMLFSHLCIRGEWFEASDELVNYLQSLDGVDKDKIRNWHQAILPSGDTSAIQKAIAKREAKAEQFIEDAYQEAKQIKQDARQTANEIINTSLDLIRKYAATEIKELTSISLDPLFFNCRCCQCGQARPTVKERDDGLPWCNTCWVNHSIFDTGRFDAIVSRASKEAQKKVVS